MTGKARRTKLLKMMLLKFKIVFVLRIALEFWYGKLFDNIVVQSNFFGFVSKLKYTSEKKIKNLNLLMANIKLRGL